MNKTNESTGGTWNVKKEKRKKRKEKNGAESTLISHLNYHLSVLFAICLR